MTKFELESVARTLVARGKGILAADESLPTISKRFERVHVELTEENRRLYREILFTTPQIEEFISGVIMYDETIRQKASDGTSFVQVLVRKRIIPGIKVDKGTIDLAGFPGEKITAGLDGLRERLKEYAELGARFTKWRAVISIGDGIPTRYCIEANAHVLARYAALSQEAGLVPIVEPEVLMDGDHDLQRCEEVTTAVLKSVFIELSEARVKLGGMLLKPNMVLPGKQSSKPASISEDAEATLRCMYRTVPAAVPGIVFLSGGQSPELATEHLNAMNRRGAHPWEIGFSFARALQDPVLRIWQGKRENVPAAQNAFYVRAKYNSAARFGMYSSQMEKAAA